MDVNILDKILEEQGLSYEDLNPIERETYNRANFSLKTISVGDIKKYISGMKNSVAIQLADLPDDDPKNAVLKARLKNYALLEAFLTRPEKAEEAIRKQLGKKK